VSIVLLRSPGGSLLLPDQASVLLDRADGGNLVVVPSRPVWDRSELNREELAQWGYLVAASGRAMLDALPQLAGGVINYWEAGNWALNDEAAPLGRKRGDRFKSVHLHLLGRSPAATNPNWRWGESPIFPRFAERLSASATFELLRPDECAAIAARAGQLVTSIYGVKPADVTVSP
jgi:diadenosine tetraphosphate (Ap4A) HIT family hydrolase